MAGLTLITPTGGRPAAFKLCEEFMAAQTYKGSLQWIVVDDCLPITPFSANQWMVRPVPRWQPGDTTQCRNMLAALPHVKHDRIIIIEDDDYYAPGYLHTMSGMLDAADLVGFGHAQYFNVRTMVYREHKNAKHASLCTTAMHRRVLPLLERICAENAQWIDIELWRRWDGSKLIQRPHTPSLSIGIKGLPGRPGIGRGHVMDVTHGYSSDPTMSMLRTWIGTAADRYREFAGG